jgi:hypothetical protein
MLVGECSWELSGRKLHRKTKSHKLLAYSGFPLELAGVGELHAAFLNESCTRGCWWCPVQEIRIRGPKKKGAAQRSL